MNNKILYIFKKIIEDYSPITAPFEFENYEITYNQIKSLLEYVNDLEKCYCNRTDCSGRIKDSKKYDSLQKQLDDIKFYIEQSDIKNMLWGKDLLEIIDRTGE